MSSVWLIVMPIQFVIEWLAEIWEIVVEWLALIWEIILYVVEYLALIPEIVHLVLSIARLGLLIVWTTCKSSVRRAIRRAKRMIFFC